MQNFTKLYMEMAERAIKNGEYPMSIVDFGHSQLYQDESLASFTHELENFLTKNSWVLCICNIPIPTSKEFHNVKIFYYKENIWADPFKKFIFDNIKNSGNKIK